MMGYSNRGGYRRSRTYAVTSGRIGKPNKRAGDCRYCKEQVPPGGGQLYREDNGSWSVVHTAAEWTGSPVSGYYVGGCPESTDRQNKEGRFGPEGGPRSERERIASISATFTASSARTSAPRAYTSSGARMTFRCNCEDAPCCGCNS
jgi:hypothetical protein